MKLENGLYMDGYLQKNLQYMKDAIKSDWDCVAIIDGMEGSGKSVLAQQIAWFFDRDLKLNQIVFTPEQFKTAVINAKKYKAIVYDEAMGGLSSRQAMSRVNKALIDMLAEIRQRNLFILIVIPSFFELDRYVAIHRSRFLINVYTDDDLNRGRFAFYGSGKKKTLYTIGKKAYNYYAAKSDFYGRYTNYYTVDEQEYRKQKLKHLRMKQPDTQKNISINELKHKARLMELVHVLYTKYNRTQQDIADMMNVDRTYVNKLLNAKKIQENSLLVKVKE